MIVLVSKFSRNELEVVLKIEIFWLFANDFLYTFNTPYCHLYPNHHIQNHVPILITYKNHIALYLPYSFMHIFGSLCALPVFKLVFSLILIFDHLINMLCLLDYFLYFLLYEFQLFL